MRDAMPPMNAYCRALGIEVPTVEAASESPDANTYSLLIAALLAVSYTHLTLPTN